MERYRLQNSVGIYVSLINVLLLLLLLLCDPDIYLLTLQECN